MKLITYRKRFAIFHIALWCWNFMIFYLWYSILICHGPCGKLTGDERKHFFVRLFQSLQIFMVNTKLGFIFLGIEWVYLIPISCSVSGWVKWQFIFCDRDILAAAAFTLEKHIGITLNMRKNTFQPWYKNKQTKKKPTLFLHHSLLSSFSPGGLHLFTWCLVKTFLTWGFKLTLMLFSAPFLSWCKDSYRF